MLTGYLEVALFEPGGLRLAGWAADQATGEAPARFTLRWGKASQSFTPHVHRPDLQQQPWSRPVPYAFELVATDLPDPCSDWLPLEVVAFWDDGRSLALPPLGQPGRSHLDLLGPPDFAAFQAHFQNPATRINNSVVQAHGAVMALRAAEPGSPFWMAAATVALYRCIEEGTFPKGEAEAVLATWETARAREGDATGERMRWVLAVSLASAYALLAWHRPKEAERAFADMLRFRPGLATWPQAVTSMATAAFMAGWLRWRAGRHDEAHHVLADSVTLLRDYQASGITPWSWFHFEEIRVALDTVQQCFILLKRIEAESGGLTWPPEAADAIRLAQLGGGERAWIGSILPPQAELSLARVSAVLRRLVERGVIADGPFPAVPA